MPKVITLFNHKGGVSKTTTTFHLGWKMAQMGKKVLIIDTDPQCNLTGLALGLEDYDSLFRFYDSRQNSNIYESIRPVFFGQETTAMIKPAEIAPTKNENLFILAGNLKIFEADVQIATAVTSSDTMPYLKNFIGVFYKLFGETAKKHDIDIVLVDMSPSVSAMNMCLLMGADYFIIPTSPDFYCYQAIDSLSEIFVNWSEKMSGFKDGYILPKTNPQLLGLISQKFSVYSKGDVKVKAKAYEQWATKIKDITNSKMIPNLQKEKMVINKEIFEKSVDYDKPYNLANIQDYNSLIACSQSLSKPIYVITKEEAKSTGVRWDGQVWDNYEKNVEDADLIYTKLAQSVLKMIS